MRDRTYSCFWETSTHKASCSPSTELRHRSRQRQNLSPHILSNSSFLQHPDGRIQSLHRLLPARHARVTTTNPSFLPPRPTSPCTALTLAFRPSTTFRQITIKHPNPALLPHRPFRERCAVRLHRQCPLLPGGRRTKNQCILQLLQPRRGTRHVYTSNTPRPPRLRFSALPRAQCLGASKSLLPQPRLRRKARAHSRHIRARAPKFKPRTN